MCCICCWRNNIRNSGTSHETNCIPKKFSCPIPNGAAPKRFPHGAGAAGLPLTTPEARTEAVDRGLWLRWPSYRTGDWGRWRRGGFRIHFKRSDASEWSMIRTGALGLSDPSSTGRLFKDRVPVPGGSFHTVSPGTAYDFRVAACGRRSGASARSTNEADYSYSSPGEVSGTVPTAAAPTGLSVTPGSSKLDLRWTAPPRTVSAVTGYRLMKRNIYTIRYHWRRQRMREHRCGHPIKSG